VGLAADCDAPEREVEKIMSSNLAGATTLPFVAILTHDLKWVGGWSGYKDASFVEKALDDAKASPLLQASEAVRKKMQGLVGAAKKAVEKGDWKSVLKAGKDADALDGRCAERDEIGAAVKAARDWGERTLASVADAVKAGGDRVEAKKTLNEVLKQFGAEPEGEDAKQGLKAIDRLGNIVGVEEGKGGLNPAGLREKAAKDYEKGRWKAIFEKR